MSNNHDNKQSVVVVGGGAAGISIVRSLSAQLDSSKYNLILINPRPYWVLLPATLRVAVSPRDNIQESVFVPYDKLFHKNNGEFIQGSVVSVEQTVGNKMGTVLLEDGQKISYNVLVLVPGSIWNGLSDFPNDADQVPKFIQEWRNKFKNAKDILLVGGGAVGIEISGEVKDLWPEKKVTIVHGDHHLLNAAYPDEFRRAAEKSVTSRGVELILNDFVDQEAPTDGLVTTRLGKTLHADLIVQARGSRPNTAFIATLGSDVLTERGHVKVHPTLQLASYENIFSAGDVIDWKEQKQAAKAGAHGALVAANVMAYLAGRPLKNYKGSSEVIVITNGKKGGVAYIGILWGILLGDWFAAMIKSKNLLVSPMRAQAGY